MIELMYNLNWLAVIYLGFALGFIIGIAWFLTRIFDGLADEVLK